MNKVKITNGTVEVLVIMPCGQETTEPMRVKDLLDIIKELKKEK